MFRVVRLPGLLALLLLLVVGLTLLLRPASRQTPATFYVAQADGLDSRTCEQARSAGTPRASINAGNACLQGGDTLRIGPGTYDELLLGQTSDSLTCHSGDAAVQPGCAPIPNGLSAAQKTTLRGAGAATILSPAGRQLPGGGYAITLHDQARYVQIEGFTLVRHSAPSSVGGIYLGNVQHVTLRGNTLDDGQIKSGVASSHIEVVGNHLFNTGLRDCPQGVKPTPAQCKHGMYVCGTDHAITDNYVHDTSYYGIQVSCEQGGIARIRIERNRVENSPVVGIRCAGHDCLVGANLLLNNGMGITLGGSGTASHNTLHDWYRPASAWNQDPFGISGDLAQFTVTNNILTTQKSAALLISPVNPATVHHNMAEVPGNAGVTLLAPASAIYTSVEAKDYTLTAGSPARGAGVPTPVLAGLGGVPYPSPPDLGAYSAASAPVPPPDQTPPVVQLTNPPPGEAVFGPSLPLAATASDNVAVVGVQFLVDGVAVGQEVRSAPYTVPLDTTAYPNGHHTFTARARDAAGLSTTAAPRALVVSNPVPPQPPDAVLLACTGRISGSTFQMACTQPAPVQR